MHTATATVAIGAALIGAAAAQERTNRAAQPAELGAVSWFRDFDAATADAKAHDRPLLVLFQEVPG